MDTDTLLSPARLQALDASGLLDSLPEMEFDQLTLLASRVLNVPVALVSLVAKDRQYFKSQIGLPAPYSETRQTSLSHSFCRQVVSTGKAFVVPDSRENEIVRNNPAITDLGVIAYAGVPVSDRNGNVLGAFCAIDDKPHAWSHEEVEILRALAAQARSEISLRTRSGSSSTPAAMPDTRDLHPPIDAVLLSIQALEYLGPLNNAQRECVQLCLHHGSTLRHLVHEIHDLARLPTISAADFRSVSPHYLAASAIEQASENLGRRNIKVSVDMDAALPSLLAEEALLSRALANLLEFLGQRIAKEGVIHLGAHHDAATGSISFSLQPPPEFSLKDGLQAPIDQLFCSRVVDLHRGGLKETSDGGIRLRLPLGTKSQLAV